VRRGRHLVGGRRGAARAGVHRTQPAADDGALACRARARAPTRCTRIRMRLPLPHFSLSPAAHAPAPLPRAGQEFLIYAVFGVLTFSAAVAGAATCGQQAVAAGVAVCTGAHPARAACVRAPHTHTHTRVRVTLPGRTAWLGAFSHSACVLSWTHALIIPLSAKQNSGLRSFWRRVWPPPATGPSATGRRCRRAPLPRARGRDARAKRGSTRLTDAFPCLFLLCGFAQHKHSLLACLSP
jgi:hypothetical protein